MTTAIAKPNGAKPAAPRSSKPPIDLGRALAQAFLTNERINQTLLDMIDPAVWDIFPRCSKRRSIATTFAHIHNVRCMRLGMSAPDDKPLARLDRARVTQVQARAALARSAKAMARLIERAAADGGHVPHYKPDVVSMVCAEISHEAHHRGQICHWARELGTPIEPEQQLRLWEWDKLWKEVTGAAS